MFSGRTHARTVTIAVVQDGPTEESEITGSIEQELERLLSEKDHIVFKTSPEFDAQWKDARYRRVIQNAMNDPGVDIVLGIGPLVTQAAADSDLELSKPFVSVTALNGEIPRMPYSEDNRSLKKNLSFVLMPLSIEEKLKAFRDLVHFQSVYVGIDAEELEDLKSLKPEIEEYSRKLDVEIVPFGVTPDIPETLARLPEDAEGFFLVRMPRIRLPEREQLIRGLNDRKIPTFSDLGPRDVERGVLATLSPDTEKQRVRRIVVNLYHIINGDGTGNLPVFLEAEPKPMINAETAVEIGYTPDFKTRMYATFLHPEAFEAGDPILDLPKVLQMAEQGNTSLRISGAQMETSRRDRQVARSPLLPQLAADASYNYSYNDSSTRLQPDDLGAAGLSLSQMIFDDEKVSNFRAAGRTYNAARYQNETDRYDVFSEAEQAYLLFVQSRILYQVQKYNLELLVGNLEIARMRFDAGIAGKDEIYRWQAQVSQQRAFLLDRIAEVASRRIALNQVLGVDQENAWRPEEIQVDPDTFSFLKGRLSFVFQSPEQYTKFGDTSIQLARENSPELKYLEQTIQAQDIQVGQRKRSFYVPRLNSGLSYGHNFWQSPDVPDLGKNEVAVGVTASLPLFEGTRRIYDLKREQSVLNELDYRMALARELVEKQTLTALQRMKGSFPGIKLNRHAADSARKNLDIVREKYSQGTVSITDLLDAQNTSFTTEQDAVAAVYTFLIDLVDYQRSISFFEDDKTPEELDAYADRIRELMGMP